MSCSGHSYVAFLAVTFDLLKLRIPATCGDLEFDSFQRCASELGKEEGCCEKDCTDFLATVRALMQYRKQTYKSSLHRI